MTVTAPTGPVQAGRAASPSREESAIVAFIGSSDPDEDTAEIPAVRRRPGWLLPLVIIFGAIAVGVLGVVLGTVLYEPPAPIAVDDSSATTDQDASATSEGTASTSDAGASTGGATTTGPETPTGPVLEIQPAGVNASSRLEDTGEITYGPENTIDGDPETAWNSDLPAGLRPQTSFSPTEAPWLTYEFDQPIELVAVSLINGYDKEERWGQNHRLRRVRIVADGEPHEVVLADSRTQQTIERGFGETSEVRLEILEVYPGTGVPIGGGDLLPPDIALSEVEFWGRRAE